jgi:hypothetical protein
MRRIYFIRHGKAVKTAEGMKDVERPLTEVGIQQAKARHEKLSGVTFDLVLSSPASRAQDTAQFVTRKNRTGLVVIESLYPDPLDGGIGTTLEVAFNRLGHAPVRKYLADEEGKQIMLLARDAWDDCDVQMHVASKDDPDVTGIFGHEVCLQALGMVLCETDEHLVAELADLEIGECEGFLVNLDGDLTVSIEVVKG